MLAQADPSLPIKVQALLLLIVAIGVVAILVVLGLMISWRRYNTRINKQRREASQQMEDTWRVGADRLQPIDDDDDEDE